MLYVASCRPAPCLRTIRGDGRQKELRVLIRQVGPSAQRLETVPLAQLSRQSKPPRLLCGVSLVQEEGCQAFQWHCSQDLQPVAESLSSA